MNRSAKYLLLLIVPTAAIAAGAWAIVHFGVPKGQAFRPSDFSAKISEPPVDPGLWARSLEKVKEDRGETGNVALEIPPQLRHYPERHWFLATQVAEVKKLNVQRCQDFLDLAAMIERGELVPLPAVTETYLLFGVAARADGGEFTRYVANQNLELNDEAGLRAAYLRLESTHATLQKELAALQTQLAALGAGAQAKQEDLQKAITARQQELKANDSEQAQLTEYYGRPGGQSAGQSLASDSRPRLMRDYNSLQALARNFGGRSYNLDEASDRQALKVALLSSLRPQALKILEEIASEYHNKFDRPLPVSSLIRPEQYQRALRRVNRYAALIDTPPHSTGLAFDIDYRYLSGAEQNFLMTKLARLKDDGRIEVLRERGANYHVFVFLDGTRPGDELIAASLAEAGGSDEEKKVEQTGANRTPVKVVRKSRRR